MLPKLTFECKVQIAEILLKRPAKLARFEVFFGNVFQNIGSSTIIQRLVSGDFCNCQSLDSMGHGLYYRITFSGDKRPLQKCVG